MESAWTLIEMITELKTIKMKKQWITNPVL